MTNLTKVQVPFLPWCSFHLEMHRHVPALFDGKVKGRQYWAHMCDRCFEEHGVGLGEGRGQRLEVAA